MNSFEEEFKKELDSQKEKQAIFNEAWENNKIAKGVDSEEEAVAQLPKQNANKYGKLELVRFDGVALTSEGEFTKAALLDAANMNIREEMYGDQVFTPTEARKVALYYRQYSKGVMASIPFLCKGPLCLFADSCVYQQINKAPINLPCAIEFDLLNHLVQKYQEFFIVDNDNIVEMNIVKELAELDIYEIRATKELAKSDNAGLLKEEVFFDKEGNESVVTKVHPSFEIKERLKNKRIKLYDLMLATRKDQKGNIKNEEGTKSYREEIEDLKKLVLADPATITYEGT